LIKTDGVTFKTLAKKYYYNPAKNEFYNVVNDPKDPDIKLDVLGKEVKKYLERLYICSVFTLKLFSNTRHCSRIKYGEVKDPLLFD